MTSAPRVVGSVVVTLTNASLRMADCGSDATYLYSCGGHGVDDWASFGVRARVRLP